MVLSSLPRGQHCVSYGAMLRIARAAKLRVQYCYQLVAKPYVYRTVRHLDS